MSLAFSIVVPVYNVELYLERCIHSILAQNGSDYEILLIDDGSTDRSSAICDSFADQYASIRVIHKENGGLSSARNAGIEAASGEYIWFVDSDDWIEPFALDRLRQSVAEETEVVRFGYYRHEGEAPPKAVIPCLPACLGDGELDELRRMAFRKPAEYILSSCTHLYRRSLLMQKALRFKSERICGSEDYLFNLLVLLQAKAVVTADVPLYHYELRKGSLTQRYKKDLPQRYICLYDCLLRHIQEQGQTARYAELCRSFFVWHLIYGTCITHEYGAVTDEHSLLDGRKGVERILALPALRSALKISDLRNIPLRRWVHWMAMKLRFESFFYWLFVVKPRRRRAYRKSV